MVGVKVSPRKIHEKATPKKASKDKIIAATEVWVYFWQIFCSKKATKVLKIPKYKMESKVLVFVNCSRGAGPSKKGAKIQDKRAAVASCTMVKRIASSVAL